MSNNNSHQPNRIIRFSITLITILIFIVAIIALQSSPSATGVQAAPPEGPLMLGPTNTFTPTPTATSTSTETPTPTLTPTASDTPAPTPSGTFIFSDAYEPNNSLGQAYEASAGIVLSPITLWPADDVDYFRFIGKAGSAYEIFTLNLAGDLDTILSVYDTNGNLIQENDDFEPLSRASKVTISVFVDGYYYIGIRQSPPIITSPNNTYDLEIKEILGTETPTAQPTGTRVPSIEDLCEDNGDFDHACVIELGTDYAFDFVPLEGEGPDNDFFRIWVKQGLFYTCETFGLSSVNDTNMIFFSGPSEDQGIAGNDDIDKEAGNLGSRIDYIATYDGWLYVLVGPVAPPEYAISNLYTYSMRCDQLAFTPTPTPTVTNTPGALPTTGPTPSPISTFVFPTAFPTPTQLPPDLFFTPVPTPQPNVNIFPLPTATTVAGGGSTNINLNITLYYDANSNFQPELNEGIMDASVALYDNATGDLLAFGYTNDAGNIRFGPIAASGAIRISVPFLNFNQVVTGNNSNILIRIAPQPLPVIIP